MTVTDFLDRAVFWLPTKKLRNRTYCELSEHFDDLCDTYKEAGLSEAEAAERALKEMGDPAIINKRLRKAHRGLLWAVRLRNFFIFSFSLIFLFGLAPLGLDQLGTYLTGMPLAEAEVKMKEEYGEDLSFLCEYKEADGTIRRFYSAYSGGESGRYKIGRIQSIRAFGIRFQNKFYVNGAASGSLSLSADGHFLRGFYSETVGEPEVCKDGYYGKPIRYSRTRLYAFLFPTEAKYFTVEFYPFEYEFALGEAEKLPTPLESDFYEISDIPCGVAVKAPERFAQGAVTLYDKDKNVIYREQHYADSLALYAENHKELTGQEAADDFLGRAEQQPDKNNN